MATINEKLQSIQNSKNAIKTAIIAKGGACDTSVFSAFAEAVESIPTGMITSYDGIKEFSSLSNAEELHNWDIVGALLSYNSTAGKFTAWNASATLANRAWNYNAAGNYNSTTTFCGNIFAESWDEASALPTDYGTVIAICLGKGMWSVIDSWDSTTTRVWATSETTMYNTLYAYSFSSRDGAEVNKRFYANANLANSPMFTAAKAARPTGVSDCRCYIPTKYELFDVWNDICIMPTEDKTSQSGGASFTNQLCNIFRFTNDYKYWSCSQDGNYGIAYYLTSGYGYIYSINKFYYFRAFLFLHFGDALAS